MYESVEKSVWMAFQPIVRMSRGSVYAYETLVRSTHAGLSSPEELFNFAQANGKLVHLGRLIRRRVAEGVDKVPQNALVFINLLPRDLLDDELYDCSAPLSQYASRVTLEITERESLDDIAGLRDKLARLRSLGFRIALDDLGAGYAGLTSLSALEPDLVKLDMGLVRNVHSNEHQRRLVAALVDMMHDEFDLPVVAEGVEVQAEREALEAMGIDLLQGFWFGRPQAEPERLDRAHIQRGRMRTTA